MEKKQSLRLGGVGVTKGVLCLKVELNHVHHDKKEKETFFTSLSTRTDTVITICSIQHKLFSQGSASEQSYSLKVYTQRIAATCITHLLHKLTSITHVYIIHVHVHTLVYSFLSLVRQVSHDLQPLPMTLVCHSPEHLK